MIRQSARPGIYTPYRGIDRPMWPYTVNRDSLQARGLVRWYPLARQGAVQEMAMGRPLSPGTLAAGSIAAQADMGIVGFFNSNSVVQLDSVNPISSNGPLSISGWLKISGGAGNSYGLGFYSGNTGDSQGCYIGHVVGASPPYYGGGWYGENYATTNNDTTKFHHLVLTYNPSGSPYTRMYFDGVEFGNGGGAKTTNNQNIAWNGSNISEYGFRGYVTDCRLYNRVLLPAEVRQMYEPQTRWELYYPLRQQVFFDFSAAAPAGNPRKGDFFTPMTGM